MLPSWIIRNLALASMPSQLLSRLVPLCSRSFRSQPWGGLQSRLTPQQINHILRLREASSADTEPPPPIKSYEASQLAANFPIEDRCIEARLLRTGGTLFAVIDGHGGSTCAQVLSERLADYVSVALMDGERLERLAKEMDKTWSGKSEFPAIVTRKLHPGDYIVPAQRATHFRWLKAYVMDRIKDPPLKDIPSQLKQAFIRLDSDISMAGLESLDDKNEVTRKVSLENLSASLSGAVTCVAYLNDCDLYIASTGDCMGMIASIDEEGQWSSQVLSASHSCSNLDEVRRITKEHPKEEATLFPMDRLLGQLSPLRAFGDCQHKWPLDKLKAVLHHHELMYLIPQNYHTPPYLTAEPEVSYHRLHANNKFMLLTTDGLIEHVDADGATQLVTEHMSGRMALQPFTVQPNSGVTLAELNLRLKKRVIAQSKKPDDANVATHIIRHALGRTQVGLDMNKLSRTLSASVEQARSERDDMTVQVVFFDTDYLRLFSPMETGYKFD